MKMKQLLILVGVVLVLWVIFVLMDQSSVPTAEENYLVDVDTTKISELEIMNGGSTITLTHRDDGSWDITNPINYRANRRYVSQLLEKLGEMRIESEVTSKQDRWPEFELDTAGVSLTIRQGEKVSSVVLGKAAESYRQSYARYADKPNVYLINGTYKMQLSRNVENWRDKEMFPYQQHQVVGIETDEWNLARNDGAWTFTVKGEVTPVDDAAATRLQSQIARLRTSAFPTEEEYASIDFDKPDNTVKISIDNGSRLDLSFYLDPNNERRYFVKYANEPTVYVLFEGIYNQIFQSADDLKMKEEGEQQVQAQHMG